MLHADLCHVSLLSNRKNSSRVSLLPGSEIQTVQDSTGGNAGTQGTVPSFPYLIVMVCGPLADPNIHELGRLHGRDADQTGHPSIVDVVLGHRRTIAFDEKGLLRLDSE